MLSYSQKRFCFHPYVMTVCFFILLNVVGVDYQHTRSCVLLLVILTNQIWFTSLCIWQITILFGTPVRYLQHSNDSLFFTLVKNILPVSELANEQLGEAKSYYYRTVKLWNNLDSFLKLSPSVEIFRRSLRSQLLDNFVNTF